MVLTNIIDARSYEAIETSERVKEAGASSSRVGCASSLYNVIQRKLDDVAPPTLALAGRLTISLGNSQSNPANRLGAFPPRVEYIGKSPKQVAQR